MTMNFNLVGVLGGLWVLGRELVSWTAVRRACFGCFEANHEKIPGVSARDLVF